MFDRLAVPIGILLNLAPYMVFCYYTFSEYIKVSKKRYALFFIIFFSVQFMANAVLDYFALLGVYELFYGSLAMCSIAFYLNVTASPQKVLYVFLLLANYESVIIAASCFIKAQLYPFVDDSQVYSFPYILTRFLLMVYTAPILFYLLLRHIKPLIRLKNVKFWNTLWVIPLTFFITLYIFTGEFEGRLVEKWQYAMVCGTLAIGSFIIYSLIAKMLIETDENAALRENVRMTARQLILQEEQYKSLSEHINEVRSARHDLRHHLSVIDTYVQTNDMEHLKDFLCHYKCSLPEDTELTLCENYTINAIAIYYTGLAHKEGVAVTTHLQIPNEINIVGSDLCIVLGNCLENGLEACRRMITGQRYIHVHSELLGSMLLITIDNSFDGSVIEQNGIFYSFKQGRTLEEGVGLSSVRAVAAKYHGSATFSHTATEFRASVMLQARRLQ